jgi:CDP-glucose 4,6-dehydratase
MENLVSIPNLSSFYKDKKVFVTGHTGFKGSWLVACLHLLGAKIKGYSLMPEYQDGLFDVLGPLKLSETVIADIRDKKRLLEELTSYGPDFVFHLAAQPLVRRSYAFPAETFDVNVTGTANLLEAIGQVGKKCSIVIITTDKVYENKEQDILYDEHDVLGGYDPYSASKACAELVTSSFRNSFYNLRNYNSHRKSLATVRAGNVIGGGDWSEDRIIPDIIRSLQNDESIKVRSPLSVRPWQHVLEPVGAYLILAALLYQNPSLYSKAYNIGPKPDDHLSVKDLVEKALQIWGHGIWVDQSDGKKVHEAELLKLSIARAERELNWRPKLEVATAIEWAIDWYKQPAEERAQYTFRQINDYFAL